ncbi:MAG TPA: co-chaperone GroES family protein [Thermoleophilia bacterium]|nr:co-chaperone GroES family protein [Thermoleophilia bacterium]
MALVDTAGQPITSAQEGSIPIKLAQEPEQAEPNWMETEFPIELFEDRICIQRDDREQMTENGLLYIPASAQSRPMTGTVIAIGEGILKGDGARCTMFISKGDRVVFEQFRAMIPVQVEGRWYHILRQTDLLGRARGAVKIRGDK